MTALLIERVFDNVPCMTEHLTDLSDRGDLVDVSVLSEAELDELLRLNELEHRRVVAARARLISAIERRRSWAVEHRTISGYLRATLNCASSTAARDLRRSRLLDAHPTLAAAVTAGHISPDHIDQIARIHTNPRIGCFLAKIIDVLVDVAEHTSHREFSDRITQLTAQLDTDGAFDDLRDSIDGRRASVVEAGGELFISAHGGDPVLAAQIQAIFDTFTQAEHRHDIEHGHERTGAQRRFDALVAIFTAAHASPTGRALPKTVVNIIVDDQTVHDTLTHARITLPNRNTLVVDTDGHLHADGRHPAEHLAADIYRDPETFIDRECRTTNGTPVHPSILLRSLLTDHVRRVIIDSRRVITDLGTTQRLFTGSARTAALLLNPTCTFPGCATPGNWSQVDHNHEHHQGGPTDQHNANTACGHHNRTKHQQQWRTKRDDRGRTYTQRPDGTIILPVGERPPDLSPHELEAQCRQRVVELTLMAA